MTHLCQLPDDVLSAVVDRLGKRDRAALADTCHALRRTVNLPSANPLLRCAQDALQLFQRVELSIGGVVLEEFQFRKICSGMGGKCWAW